MEYNYIVNPVTNRKCRVDTALGKKIVNTYAQNGGFSVKNKLKKFYCGVGSDCSNTNKSIGKLKSMMDIEELELSVYSDKTETKLRFECLCGKYKGMDDPSLLPSANRKKHDTIRGSNYFIATIKNSKELSQQNKKFNNLLNNDVLITVHPKNTNDIRFRFTLKDNTYLDFRASGFGIKMISSGKTYLRNQIDEKRRCSNICK